MDVFLDELSLLLQIIGRQIVAMVLSDVGVDEKMSSKCVYHYGLLCNNSRFEPSTTRSRDTALQSIYKARYDALEVRRLQMRGK